MQDDKRISGKFRTTASTKHYMIDWIGTVHMNFKYICSQKQKSHPSKNIAQPFSKVSKKKAVRKG